VIVPSVVSDKPVHLRARRSLVPVNLIENVPFFSDVKDSVPVLADELSVSNPLPMMLPLLLLTAESGSAAVPAGTMVGFVAEAAAAAIPLSSSIAITDWLSSLKCRMGYAPVECEW
jgi:hypothetical protein